MGLNSRNVYLGPELETEFDKVAKDNERSFSAELRLAARHHIARHHRQVEWLDPPGPPSKSNGPVGDGSAARSTADAGGGHSDRGDGHRAES
jgi:hypothetical protein